MIVRELSVDGRIFRAFLIDVFPLVVGRHYGCGTTTDRIEDLSTIRYTQKSSESRGDDSNRSLPLLDGRLFLLISKRYKYYRRHNGSTFS
jgi:hypothetical protein